MNDALSGKVATDDVLLSSLSLKPGFKVMMMGSREEAIVSATKEPDEVVDVLDDFDVGVKVISLPKRQEYIAKVSLALASGCRLGGQSADVCRVALVCFGVRHS